MSERARVRERERRHAREGDGKRRDGKRKERGKEGGEFFIFFSLSRKERPATLRVGKPLTPYLEAMSLFCALDLRTSPRRAWKFPSGDGKISSMCSPWLHRHRISRCAKADRVSRAYSLPGKYCQLFTPGVLRILNQTSLYFGSRDLQCPHHCREKKSSS